MLTCEANKTCKIFCQSKEIMSFGILGEYAKHVFGVLDEYSKWCNFLRESVISQPRPKKFKSLISRLDGLDFAKKPSHTTFHLRNVDDVNIIAWHGPPSLFVFVKKMLHPIFVSHQYVELICVKICLIPSFLSVTNQSKQAGILKKTFLLTFWRREKIICLKPDLDGI